MIVDSVMNPVLLCLLTVAFAMPALGADAAAERLARRVYDRDSAADVVSEAVMLLARKGRKPRKRVFYTYRKDKGGRERWSLARFLAPADVRNVGLLTLDHPGDSSDQWLYLPALDRVRRIASSRKGGRFMGSDLYYEDLRDREPEMDHHRLAGKGKAGGLLCDILVSTPVKRGNSIYSKRVSWIHPKTLIPLRVDLYRRRHKRPVKRLKVHKIKRIQGHWTVLDSTMYDLRSGHSTRVVVKKIRYDQGLPDSLFSRKALADPSRERRYRP